MTASTVKPRSWIAALLLLCSLLSACSTHPVTLHDSLLNRLKDRGPVALSSENPYLAANLLVTREMKESPTLEGFIRHRGAPAAIEIEKEYFSPLRMFFFYPENREYFALEHEEENWQENWTIRGPIIIEQEKFRHVLRLTHSLEGNRPVLEFPGDELPVAVNRDIAKGAADTVKGSPSPPKTTPAPTPKKAGDPFIERLKAYEKAQAASQHSQYSGETEQFRPQDTSSPRTLGADLRAHTGQTESPPFAAANTGLLDSIIGSEGQHPAELTPKGDLVHYISFPGETLSMIARWYTKDRNNANRLARINKFNNPNEVNLGDVVIVPSYLVKNEKRLSEGAVQKLTELAAQERGR